MTQDSCLPASKMLMLCIAAELFYYLLHDSCTQSFLPLKAESTFLVLKKLTPVKELLLQRASLIWHLKSLLHPLNDKAFVVY